VKVRRRSTGPLRDPREVPAGRLPTKTKKVFPHVERFQRSVLAIRTVGAERRISRAMAD